jgi:hypothetical protein
MSHRECRAEFGSPARCVSLGTCGPFCLFENFCLRIDRDPAKIRFSKSPDQLDFFTAHGRFVVEREGDPTKEGFEVTLSNENGTIFAAALLRGQMTAKGKGYRYLDKTAKTTGGLSLVRAKFKTVKGKLNLTFRVKAYGDFSSATEPRMTLRVRFGTQGGFAEEFWNQTRSGWSLSF